MTPHLPLTTPSAIIVDPVPDFNPRSVPGGSFNPVDIELEHLGLGDIEELEGYDLESDDDLEMIHR